ncbi:hypothetical protein H1R20_g11069, partial [Candolleomyces eurysporus]
MAVQHKSQPAAGSDITPPLTVSTIEEMSTLLPPAPVTPLTQVTGTSMPTEGPSSISSDSANRSGFVWDTASLQSYLKVAPTAFGIVSDAPPATLSASVASHFNPTTLDPVLVPNGGAVASGLMPSAANGFTAPPSLPALPPPKTSSRANKENVALGSRAPPGSGKFCIGNYKGKKTGKARFAPVWYAIPGNKGRQTSDFNAAWEALPSEEKAGYEPQAAALRAAVQ